MGSKPRRVSALDMLGMSSTSGPRCPLCAPGGPLVERYRELVKAVNDKGCKRGWRPMAEWLVQTSGAASLSPQTLQRHARLHDSESWGAHL